MRRRRFWWLCLQTLIVLSVLSLFVEVPAFWIAKGKDERQALEILENRRSIFSQTFSQMLRVKNKVESASNAAEADVHMRSILDSPTSSPGLVGIGTISWGLAGERWDIHRQVISEGSPEIVELLRVPRVAEMLQKLQTRQTAQLTPLFQYAGGLSNKPKVFCVLLVPLKPTAAIHPGGSGMAAQILIIDVVGWAQQTYLPASLRSVKFYLSNELDDGLRVGFNYQKEEGQKHRPADVMTIGLDPQMKVDALAAFPLLKARLFGSQPLKDTPAGLLSYLSKVDESVPPTNENGSRFKVARSAIISFNIAPETRIRCNAEATPEFFKNSTTYALLRILPLFSLGLCLVSALMAMLWMLYWDGREQIHQLAEAQRTISSLDLYRNLVQQELHDHIIQNLTLLGIQVATKGTQDAEGQKVVRETILKQIDYLRRELRRFLADGAHRLETIPDLVVQLQGICRHLETQSGARCQVNDSMAGSPILSPEILFRVCRFTEELVGNAIRHGGAQVVLIEIGSDAAVSTVQVIVEDDGMGFDPDNHSKGFGLQNIAAFARRSKGALTIERRQPRGMRIQLSIPVTFTSGK